VKRKITLEEAALYKEDYQLRMLKANHLTGMLNVNGRGINQTSYYDYDVTGKVSMKAMYERGKIGAEDIILFLKQFIESVQEVERYLLNINCILLQPEYIFYEEERFYFCYYPPAEQDLWEAFHGLTEYFVKQGDYQDQNAVQMIFILHKGTMEENYSIDKLLAECMQVIKESEEMKTEPEYDEKYEYDTSEHDWITEQEMGSSIMRETDNLWTPVRRLLNRRKKQKWGDWDGLHIEEEEL
jgi:hypothetical protein